MVTDVLPEQLSGYATEDKYLGTTYRQGGRQLYTVDLSIPQLVGVLARPDPDRKLQGNRKISLPHARAFSTYVRNRVDAVVPPLLLRCPEGVLQFEPLQRIGGSEWGVVSVPRLARNELKIVDGQHRVLGFHLAMEALATDMASARDRLGSARRNSDDAVIAHAQAQVDKLAQQRDRLAHERISLLVVIVDDPDEYKQVFVDIADNAKGITRTTRALFDREKIVHRCLDDVMQHPLLLERVDLDRDRILGDNPNVMGAKHVADVIRTLEVGIAGRISRRQEDELREEDLVDQTRTFLDVLVDSFPDFAHVADGSLTMGELRGRSLLGSVVIHRVLAGCYHELTKALDGPPRMNRLQIQRFFEKLAPFTAGPVTEESPWRRLTDVFEENAMAPHARAQDLRKLTDTMVAWAISPPDWLNEGRNP